MKHEDCMEQDPDYERTYNVLKKEELSIDKILEVVIKSNGIVGVGIITFKQQLAEECDNYIKGY